MFFLSCDAQIAVKFLCSFCSCGPLGIGVIPSLVHSHGNWAQYPICDAYGFAPTGLGRVVSTKVSYGCRPSANSPCDFSHDGGIAWHDLEHVDLEQSTQWLIIGSGGANIRNDVDDENINIGLSFL